MMKCKFCGCTDKRPCAIAMTFGSIPEILAAELGIDPDDMPLLALPGQIARFSTPCHWSAPNVCSAPACIALAYIEASELVDLLLEAA